MSDGISEELAMSVAQVAIAKQAERIAELEAKLATLRPIARAAVLEKEAEDRAAYKEQLRAMAERRRLARALSPGERSELLKGSEDG